MPDPRRSHEIPPAAQPGEIVAGKYRVDRLLARELVTRQPSPTDRRGVLVELTPAGVRAVDGAMEALLTRERAVLAGLSEADRRALAGFLRELQAGLDAPE